MTKLLTVVVCGASQGMGFATAKLFAEKGFRVIGIARNLERLEAAFTNLVNPSIHKALAADLSDLEQVKSLVLELQQYSPSILVNNSGGPKPTLASKATSDEYLQAFTQHLLASSILTQGLIPSMIESQYGRIINIVSVSGRQPSENIATSNVVRAGVLSWSKTLANEVALHGITVNSVLPGYTKTERLQEVITARAENSSSSEDAVIDKLLMKIPMRRFAEPSEIAAAVLFLASPEASYITGTTLAVDGGYLSV